ncbi:hypothetical protein OHA27_37950 [Streptomyces sp. NBC_01619]|uniref:hypothetical protein n=1 Tax=Streptomyces sp. NBC_01619 TaxID=2975901 RepID=UPI00224DE0BF|nr:hypothetical protein [Streptomyces sp. NBC_01619]MCX4515905.1 hypothetical protein [Streptomyces sp. NBC_01619]
MLGEFDDDPDAVERLMTAHTNGRFSFQAARERDDRAEREARDAVRAQLAAAGTVLYETSSDLPAESDYVSNLVDAEGQPLDASAHTSCPGHAVTWDIDADESERAALVAMCADPEGNGHHDPDDLAPAAGSDASTKEEPTRSAPKPDEVPYALKVEGNKQYRAARTARRKWLREELLTRKTAPKAVAPFVTEQLLACPKPVQSWSGDVSRVALLAELLGQQKTDPAAERAQWAPGNATPGRLMLLNFAVLAACHEKKLDDVQTWRHDAPQWDSEATRADARVYLAFLGELGYPLTAIEQAIITGEPFTLQNGQESEDGGQTIEGADAA